MSPSSALTLLSPEQSLHTKNISGIPFSPVFGRCVFLGSGARIDGDGPIIKVGDEAIVISKITSERTVTGELSFLFFCIHMHIAVMY